jgi:hypothetical protein
MLALIPRKILAPEQKVNYNISLRCSSLCRRREIVAKGYLRDTD